MRLALYVLSQRKYALPARRMNSVGDQEANDHQLCSFLLRELVYIDTLPLPASIGIVFVEVIRRVIVLDRLSFYVSVIGPCSLSPANLLYGFEDIADLVILLGEQCKVAQYLGFGGPIRSVLICPREVAAVSRAMLLGRFGQ